jgi:hypothetical protein
MELHVVPDEGGLDDVTQAGKSGVRAHEQAAPDDGAGPPQYDTQLVDGRGWGWQRSGHSGILASGVTEPFGAASRHRFARSPDNGPSDDSVQCLPRFVPLCLLDDQDAIGLWPGIDLLVVEILLGYRAG